MDTHSGENSRVFMFGSQQDSRTILFVLWSLLAIALGIGFFEQGITDIVRVIWILCEFLLVLYLVSRYRKGVIIDGDTVTVCRRIFPDRSFLVSDITRITQRIFWLDYTADAKGHFISMNYLDRSKEPRTVGFEIGNINKNDFVQLIDVIRGLNKNVLVDQGVKYWYEKWKGLGQK